YLASIDSFYAGHQMVVDLFDPGEGGQTIELLDPKGNPVTFDYTTPDSVLDPTLPQISATGVNQLDVSGSSGRLPNRLNSGKFNERLVEITVNLPANYAGQYGSNTWWSLRYNYGQGKVGDRTTWSVS